MRRAVRCARRQDYHHCYLPSAQAHTKGARFWLARFRPVAMFKSASSRELQSAACFDSETRNELWRDKPSLILSNFELDSKLTQRN